ncbi:hypothetical protein HDV02_001713 [Globomyces sp. JEL0801]|nr:hypothetical protein HDV02_001713 [Globomyces sp. JEL0801]
MNPTEIKRSFQKEIKIDISSQPLILGFAHSKYSKLISLTPFRHPTRLISMYMVNESGELDEIISRDCYHDANKLYVSYFGLPEKSVKTSVDLEDFGVHFQIEPTKQNEPIPAIEVSTEAPIGAVFHHAKLGIFSAFQGASWITEDEPVKGNERILICVAKQDEMSSWTIRAERLSTFLQGSDIKMKLQEIASDMVGSLQQGMMIFPIVQPKRYEIEQGIVYVG